MYWEEAIELIKTHQSKPGTVYDYINGTLKSGYINIESFPPKFKEIIEKYSKYDLTDLQLFCSIGASEGIGEHTDFGNVLIICLEGEVSYSIERTEPVTLKAGDTILIPDGDFLKVWNTGGYDIEPYGDLEFICVFDGGRNH